MHKFRFLKTCSRMKTNQMLSQGWKTEVYLSTASTKEFESQCVISTVGNLIAFGDGFCFSSAPGHIRSYSTPSEKFHSPTLCPNPSRYFLVSSNERLKTQKVSTGFPPNTPVFGFCAYLQSWASEGCFPVGDVKVVKFHFTHSKLRKQLFFAKNLIGKCPILYPSSPLPMRMCLLVCPNHIVSAVHLISLFLVEGWQFEDPHKSYRFWFRGLLLELV